MAKTVQQQIEAEKKRLANEKTRLENEAKSAELTAANKKSNEASRKKIAALQSDLEYISQRLKPYIKRLASNDTLSVTEQNVFDGLSEQFNEVKDTISATAFPGATKPKSDTTPNLAVMERPKPATAAKSPVVAGAKSEPKPEVKAGSTAGTPAGASSGNKTSTGKSVPSNFDVGSFRMADEASMAKADGVTPSGIIPTLGGDVFAQAQSKFGGIDEVFKTNDELKKLLIDAINGKWGVDRFTNELENTKWFKTNAGPIRQRGFYKRQYDALVSGLKNDDPNYQSRIDELNRTSEWGRGLENASETVIEEWTRQYGTPTTEDLITIKSIASELYQYANEADAVKIRNLVLAKPKRFSPTAILGGDQGENISSLKAVAAANGLNLDKNFATSIQTWLDRLAKGESIETIKSIIRNTAKTTWNVNDRISGLLDQGVDLDTIYTPYKTRMANILEIAPGTITFDDLASKGIIGGKEEKNLYDFEKELRQDNRWQYTGTAKEEVSNAALGVLRDFGFQG